MNTDDSSKLFLERYFDSTCQKFATVKQVIDQYGHLALGSYLQSFDITEIPAYQSREDLFKVVYDYASSLLGRAIAQRLVQDLRRYPVVLTANHHGIDYFSQSFQANLIFAINKLTGQSPTTTVPIFSCGNVSLNTATYPRGLLLYHVNPAKLETMPERLPIFSRQFKSQILNVVPAFNRTMIQNAITRFDNMVRQGELSPTLTETVHAVLQQDYSDPILFQLPLYSQQAVILSNAIWKRLIASFERTVDTVHLEQEPLVSDLLQADLLNAKSLVWAVLFDSGVRERILTNLDGVALCWQRDKLVQRLQHTRYIDPNANNALKELEACGTTFFWGIDEKSHRIPLLLTTAHDQQDILQGVDAHGDLWQIPYTPQALIWNLRARRILPSGLTCFLAFSFARGLACLGGYFQCEYLPIMQREMIAALQNFPRYHEAAEMVAQVPTTGYLYGMLAVMTKIQEDSLIPAGPIEMISGGSLTKQDLEQIQTLSVRDAHLAALTHTLLNIPIPDQAPIHLKTQLAADCFMLLRQKVVVK